MKCDPASTPQYINNTMDQLKEVLEGTIDFEGQKLVESLNFWIINIGTALSFLVGFVLQRLDFSVYLLVATLIVVEIAIVPPWKSFNKHPLKWQSPSA